MSAPDYNAMDPDEFADAMCSLPPVITMEQLREGEKITTDVHGVTRRACLAMLTKSMEEVSEMVLKDPTMCFEVFQSIPGSIEHHKGIVKLMTVAQYRLMTALCVIDPEAPGAPFTEAEFSAACALLDSK